MTPTVIHLMCSTLAAPGGRNSFTIKWETLLKSVYSMPEASQSWERTAGRFAARPTPQRRTRRAGARKKSTLIPPAERPITRADITAQQSSTIRLAKSACLSTRTTIRNALLTIGTFPDQSFTPAENCVGWFRGSRIRQDNLLPTQVFPGPTSRLSLTKKDG